MKEHVEALKELIENQDNHHTALRAAIDCIEKSEKHSKRAYDRLNKQPDFGFFTEETVTTAPCEACLRLAELETKFQVFRSMVEQAAKSGCSDTTLALIRAALMSIK